MVPLNIIDEDISGIISSFKEGFLKLKGQSVLITGANGFLPAYFADTIRILNSSLLKKHPAKLICMVRRKAEDCSRISYLKNDPYTKFIIQDVGKDFKFNLKVDYIIHGASRASPKDYRANPIDTIDANVNGTRQILEYATKNKIKGFLFLSSGEVYGNPDSANIPTREDYCGNVDCQGPRSCYAEAKRFSEALCAAFYEQYKVPVKIARPYHIYGPGLRLDDGRAMADFFRDALKGKEIRLLSNGLATRTFCYISDATEAFWRVLLNGKDGRVYNVGSDKPEVSMKELAKLVAEIFERKVSYRVKLDNKKIYLKGSADRACPSLDRLKQELDYSPKITLKKGLLRLKDWYLSCGYDEKCLWKKS